MVQASHPGRWCIDAVYPALKRRATVGRPYGTETTIHRNVVPRTVINRVTINGATINGNAVNRSVISYCVIERNAAFAGSPVQIDQMRVGLRKDAGAGAK
jgi:hypothetical protein